MKATNTKLTTKRDKDGNYYGELNGVNFNIYGYGKNWEYSITYYSEVLCRNVIYFSCEDCSFFETKKATLEAVKNCILKKDYK